jgi:hypothetical protein
LKKKTKPYKLKWKTQTDFNQAHQVEVDIVEGVALNQEAEEASNQEAEVASNHEEGELHWLHNLRKQKYY